VKIGVDFDRVLFDTDGFKKNLTEKFPEFNETYNQAKKDSYYNLEKHARLLGVEEEKLLAEMRKCEEYLYSDVKKLEKLKDKHELLIVTRGDPVVQKEKLEYSGALEYFNGYEIVTDGSKDVRGIDFLVDDWKEECDCSSCGFNFIPQEGNVSRGGKYNCSSCGQKSNISEGVHNQGDYENRLYALEYYCEKCDNQGCDRAEFKGYKTAEAVDHELYQDAASAWETDGDLHEYVPSDEIRPGWKTASRQFEGSAPGAGDLSIHGIENWTDFFNERQLLSLSKLLEAIDRIENQNVKEYLLLSFSESLNYNSLLCVYNPNYNKNTNVFKSNSFDPPSEPIEGHPWGADYGTGTFGAMWDMVVKGVEYANKPTDRFIQGDETKETAPFSQPIGQNSSVYQGDMRLIDSENEYDAVITDPPYYHNIIYSELSDYFYVWQKILLSEEYEAFDKSATPREDSIVSNPAENKDIEEFEHEIGEALNVINQALKSNGILTFTYHHSDKESWGELLESLCNNDFEVTATYPVNSDLNKFFGGESVSFDIVIVARPTTDRTPISWRRLRIDILNRLEEIQESLEEQRDLSEGDMGVVEMGACFSEYSKHHGEVRRGGEIMTAKEAVEEIYGIIQNNALGEQDLFLALQRNDSPGYDDFNKLLRRSEASEEEMREKALFRMDGDDFIVGDWRDEKRRAYIRTKVGEDEGSLTVLDKAHLLRYYYEEDKSTKEYLERWSSDDLEELCEGLAEATHDETYLKMIGVDTSLAEFADD